MQKDNFNQKLVNNFLVENVPLEEQLDIQKPPNDNFNIKGFLIEMRNKQGNIQVVEKDQQPSPIYSKNKQFAMIIEENSPQNHDQMASTQQPVTLTLESSRRLQVVDSQMSFQKKLMGQKKKPVNFQLVKKSNAQQSDNVQKRISPLPSFDNNQMIIVDEEQKELQQESIVN